MFVKGGTKRDKFDGPVDLERRPASCKKFLWFIDNRLVRSVKQSITVFY